MFDFINQAFGYVLRFFYNLIPNYAVALLLFAVFVKIILFPLGIKQQKNMVKQASLRPKEAAIRKKYAGRTDKVTQQKLNEEIMGLYQSENFSPMSGCLPMLIQLPIIFILYEVIRRPLKYLCMLSDETIAKIGEVCKSLNPDMAISVNNDISFIEPIKNNFEAFKEVLGDFTLADLPNFNVFGVIDLSETPTVALNWLILIPILTFVFQFFSMKLTRKFTYQAPAAAGGPDVGKSMKIMDYTMPLMTVWISFMMPAVIAMYWIYQNIFGVVQQIILSKMYPIPTFTDEELKRLEKEYGGNVKKEKKKVRSLHNIDKDDSEVEQSQSEKTAIAETNAPISVAQMKDESDRKKGNETAQTEKKKVRSLHHIDDDGYENGYKIEDDGE